MINYEKFRHGLQMGLGSLWNEEFMSGLRNGGFEQTLRNACLFQIEQATGRIAFTESRGRADLLLCGEKDDSSTRCEFKVNFALQYSKIHARKRDAIGQVQNQPLHFAEDGVVVYAIAELIQSPRGLLGKAKFHNDHVESTPYKQFQTSTASEKAMKKIRTRMEESHKLGPVSVPAFDALFGEDGLSMEWQGNTAKIHAWTHHIPSLQG